MWLGLSRSSRRVRQQLGLSRLMHSRCSMHEQHRTRVKRLGQMPAPAVFVHSARRMNCAWEHVFGRVSRIEMVLHAG